jgi:predicted lipoprotein with Yx(FWY)xxD motif
VTRNKRISSRRARLLTVRAVCGGAAAALVTALAIGTAVAASATTIRSANNPNYAGRILEGPARYTLYVFCTGANGDHCTGTASRLFTALIARGRVVAAAHSNIKASKLRTRRLRNGQHQVTYYGQPLYLYRGDRKPGQTRGEEKGNSKGSWFVISTSGRALARGVY